MAHIVDCQHCGFAFEAKMPHAKWCSPKCRKAAQRAATREQGESNVRDIRSHLSIVGDPPPAPEPRSVEPFSVQVTLAAALGDVEADDKVTRFRKAHALTLATVLDDPGKSQQWKGISEALATVLAHLIAAQKPGSANALQGIVDAIRGT